MPQIEWSNFRITATIACKGFLAAGDELVIEGFDMAFVSDGHPGRHIEGMAEVLIPGFRDASLWIGGSGLFGFGIQACMCDPLGRLHLLWQKGQLGQESQGTRLRDARRRAEALVGTLEGLIVQNEIEGLAFQVCNPAFEVSNIHLNIACDETCAADVVALRVVAALFADDLLLELVNASGEGFAVEAVARSALAKAQKACARHSRGSTTHPSHPSSPVACRLGRTCSSLWD